ncbi:ArsR family transcriptional regulator [Candidatus Bathyarchaeota archaeon]|nr:ArsR family transcriptional regulator [Candidatus Bathyarchaeota archaeon]
MEAVIESNLDILLKILENPIRRKIIERLSQEPNYTLQIAKELGLGQQLVAKHLKLMEKCGLVKSNIQSSPTGPQRRVFGLVKSLSITVDVAPHLFKQDIMFFDLTPDEQQIPETLESLIKRKNRIVAYSDWKDKINPFAKLLSDIDLKLEILEDERMFLLSIRNSIMREVSKVIQKINDANARRVFHQALDEHDQSIRKLSQALNLREEIVKQVIQKIKRDFDTGYFE